MATSGTTRFASVSEAELNRLVEDKDAKNTKRATKLSLKIFREYLREKSLEEPQDKGALAIILKSFYVEARKSDGTAYSKSSLCSLRFGLNRHYKAVEGIDVINDPVFSDANKVFLAKCVWLKRQGLAKVHKPVILDSDVQKLYECGVFRLDDPKTLQNKVFFEICYYFCRRSRLNLRDLKTTDFSFGHDENGSRYVYKLTSDERRESDEDRSEGGIMYEIPGPACPVGSLELYLKHLNPKNPFLFQRPKKNTKIGVDEICYDNIAVGERMLADKMKTISKEAKLSKLYTNHSIKASSLAKLDSSVSEVRNTMTSGVKSENSTTNYCPVDVNMTCLRSPDNESGSIIGDEVHEVKPMSSRDGQNNGDSSQYVFGFTPPGSDGSDSENELEDKNNSYNTQSPDSGSVHYVVAPEGSSPSQLMLIEELNQLREDNQRLQKEVEDLTTSRDTERKKALALQKKLTTIEKQESDETAALENMVHLVEQNLELTTKRALKAEALVSKLKEELKCYKTESVPMETYQQLVDTHHSTLNAIKAKSRSASDEMAIAARRAEQALRDLYSGVDTLKIVSSELNYIDRITDVTPRKENS